MDSQVSSAGSTVKRSLQKRLAAPRGVSRHTNGEVEGQKKCGGKKGTSDRDNPSLERKPLAWAKDQKDQTGAGSQGPWVWRKRGEARNPRGLSTSVTVPQPVMVWGAMSSAGVGPVSS